MGGLLALCTIVGSLSGIYTALDYVGSRQIRSIADKLKADEGFRQETREAYDKGMVIGPKQTLPKGIFTYFAEKYLHKQLRDK